MVIDDGWEEIDDGWTRIDVGRDGVAVDDPLNIHRVRFDENLAREIDRDATILGVTCAQLDDRILEMMREEVGKPLQDLPSWAPDISRRDWIHEELRAEEAMVAAATEVNAHAIATSSEDPERFAARRAELLELVAPFVQKRNELADAREGHDSSLTWTGRRHAEAVTWVAVAREQAIRRELARVRAGGEPIKRVLSKPLREIGPDTDVSALKIEQVYEREYDTLRDVDRNGVNASLTAERLKDLLGDERTQLLSLLMGPVREWVKGHPSWFVRQRRRELGEADWTLDRTAAREMARLEAALALVERERDATLVKASDVERTDRDRAKVTRARAVLYQGRVERIARVLAVVAQHDNSPERWATASRVVLTAAYDDEFRTRQAAVVNRAIERSLRNPPAHVVERLGPRPDPERSPGLAVGWSRLVRELEGDRVRRELAALDETEPPEPRSAAEERRLQTQIDTLREQRRLAAAQQQTPNLEVNAAGIFDGWEHVQISRDGVAVPDPLNKYRSFLPEHWARWVDREATLLGVEYSGDTDATLEERLRALGEPLDRFDRHPPEEHVDWTASGLAREEALEAARAELHALELERDRHDPASFECRRVELQHEIERQQAAVFPLQADHEPWLRWSAEDQAAGVKWVATVREQAIRRELVQRALGAGVGEAPARSMPMRAIGSEVDVGSLKLERARDAAELGSPIAWDREHVKAPRTVERLGGPLGDERTQRMSRRMEPLANWASELPSWWIRERLAEIGTVDQQLDRPLAREVAHIETGYLATTKERDEAIAESVEYADSDRERAAVASHTVRICQEQLQRMSDHLTALADYSGHPDQIANSSRAVLAAVYHDELEVRRHVWIESAMEASLENPPAHLQERIGPAPARDAPHRDKWETVARQLEARELAYSSALREGLEPPDQLTTLEERELQHRIDAVRATQGMEPDQLTAQRQTPALGRGGIDMA